MDTHQFHIDIVIRLDQNTKHKSIEGVYNHLMSWYIFQYMMKCDIT